MPQGTATVKAVLSGDSVVLIGSSTNGPPPELSLTISHIQAPRLARSPEQTSEAFAWESREYLRNLLIGQKVYFSSQASNSSNARVFGEIKFKDQDVATMIVENGWARAKDESGELKQLQVLAQQACLGMYATSSASFSELKWVNNDSEDLKKMFNTHQGKPIQALIENIRDGSFVRLILLEGEDKLKMIPFHLAGIQCPRNEEPFAKEAKYFFEVRLLHRTIQVVFQGVDKYNNLFGSIIHPAGNISLELMKNGLGKMVDWTAIFLNENDRLTLRNGERSAKNQQIRIWKNFQAPTQLSSSLIEGEIIEVFSGDTIVVYDLSEKTETRFSLSSLQAPRLGNAKKGEPNAPYSIEAKEFLIEKAIGKRVYLTLDYERENTNDERNKRKFASVYLDAKKKTSLSGLLVSEGFAQVIRHREGESRAENYDALLTCEEDAKKKKKNIFNPKEYTVSHRCTDLSTDAVKAKQYLPFLKRERVVKGRVEFVLSGNRFKVFIPKENCLINFSCTGVKVPKREEAFSEEAKNWSRRYLNQRTVDLELDEMDKGGTIFGIITVKDRQDGCFGVELLKQGLGSVDSYTIDKNRFSREMNLAQEKAQEKQLGLWKDFKEKKPIVNQMAKSYDEEQNVVISEVVDGGHFYVQKANDPAVRSMENSMKEFTLRNGLQGGVIEVKKNSLVAALFDDGSSNGLSWFRARVEGITKVGLSQEYHVRFIDYGNLTTVSMTRLRALDSELLHVPALAKPCVFGFLKIPTLQEEFGEEAACNLNDLTCGKTLSMKIHDQTNQEYLVSLYDTTSSSEKFSISEELIKAGLLRVDRKARALSHQKEVLNGLKEAQEMAKKSRVNLWQYGDIESDDEY